MTLERALQLAHGWSPALAERRWELRAAEALAGGAGRAPNPTLRVEVENWGGGLGSGRMESTLGITRPIELGGDRAARRRVAETEVELARAETAIGRRDLDAEVVLDFVSAWSAQERLASLKESRRLSLEAVAAAGERHRVGAAPAVERARAEATLSLLDAEIRRATAALSIARRDLALRWGADAGFDSLALPGPDLALPGSADSLLAGIEAHPELARARAESRLAEAQVAAARAARTPDVEATLGLRRLEEEHATGFIAALEIPLPIANRGGEALVAAEARRSAAAARAAARSARLRAAARSALDRLEGTIGAYLQLRDRAVPLTAEALDDLSAGYRAGRLSYLDRIEGQRAALEARLSLIEAAADVWRSRLELDRLIAPSAGEGREERIP